MGKSSGALWVSLGIKTSEFSKGLKRAKKDMNSFQKFGAGLKNMFNPLTVGVGAFAAIGAAVLDGLQTIKEFDQAMADLSAITGATGEDLKDFRKEVLNVANSTGKGAVEIAKAFQLVGSAQPDLLKSSVALAEVTKQAVILAQAGGLEVPAAADALTKSMNQFGVGADQAAHFIDVLASSQQKGTATIDQLAEAMVKGGGTARGMGLNFEEANVLLQAFAKGGVTGSEAGTQMAGVLSKLAKVTKKEFNPTQTNAIDVIKNLSTSQMSYKDLIGLTDAEGAKWLTTLINNVGVLDELNGGLGKNGSALEQAETRTDTVAGKQEKLGNAWDSFIISLDGATSVIGRAYKSLLGFFTDAVSGLKDLDIGWKAAFSGMADFTEEELSRALDGAYVTKFGQNITDVTKEFDKVPLKKMAGDVKKYAEEWATVLGWDKADSLRLFNQYLKDRSKKEKALAAASKKVAEATEEEKEETEELTEEQIKAIKAARQLEMANYKAINSMKVGSGELMKSAKAAISGLVTEMSKGDMSKGLQVPITPKLEIEADTTSKFTGAMVSLGEAASDALNETITAGLNQMANIAGETLGAALSGDKVDIGGALISAMAGLMQTLGAQMIALGLAQESLKASLTLGPLGAALAIGGGIALIAAATVVKNTMADSATGFAEGGMVTGSVFANVGEGRGTTKSNPEVITPLDKLQGMLNVGGGMDGNVTFRIEGTTLVGVLNRQGKSTKYSR